MCSNCVSDFLTSWSVAVTLIKSTKEHHSKQRLCSFGQWLPRASSSVDGTDGWKGRYESGGPFGSLAILWQTRHRQRSPKRRKIQRTDARSGLCHTIFSPFASSKERGSANAGRLEGRWKGHHDRLDKSNWSTPGSFPFPYLFILLNAQNVVWRSARLSCCCLNSLILFSPWRMDSCIYSILLNSRFCHHCPVCNCSFETGMFSDKDQDVTASFLYFCVWTMSRDKWHQSRFQPLRSWTSRVM